MYDNKTHKVADRIVSIAQPYIRPIVRGKTKSPVEFGIKFDLSIDEDHMGRIEKITFDPYMNPKSLREPWNHKTRTGHYPERVLADQIYRTKKNRKFCKENGIRLSGPKLGRPSRNSV
ncbi:MAG: transposase [bacterium LCO1.1]|uniref:Transposase n=1 Tax=Candidatus Weimeria bifida TaxID=2599074 RepID=A0A6N7IYD0_9FIRM|nr:transposase [Candidatus Weimeria bifida]